MTITIVSVVVVCIFLVLLYVARRRAIIPEQLPTTEDVALDTILAEPPPIPYEPIIEDEENTLPMADFNIAYAIVRDHEAEYQNLRQDRGNYNSRGQLVGTNWGINAQVYESHLGRPPSESDMRNMPQSTAVGIFKRLYWDRIYGDTIPDQQLANIFLDGIINHGRGVELMQEVLGVTQDNRYGPLTHGALLAANPRNLHDAYKARRRRYYHQLVAWDASQAVFLRGWLRRIDSFHYSGTPGSSTGIVATVSLALIAYLFLP